MRNRFDQQLELLNKQLIYMGELCEEAIGKATTALKEGSMEQAEKVRIADEEIDQAETDIERLCLRLLLQQQPVAVFSPQHIDRRRSRSQCRYIIVVGRRLP